MLVKRAFDIEIEDFEISKYLKTRTKNQWMDKYKELKDIPKTGFKAHQGYASKIITSYAKNFRKRKLEKKMREEEERRNLGLSPVEGEENEFKDKLQDMEHLKDDKLYTKENQEIELA